MAEISPEEKKALEEQKAQCPFCKIIKGEIPSRMTFQDDRCTAVLDINPIVPGHTLLLTKEHYAILPLIPREDFVHLFRVVKDYAFAQKRSLVKAGATVFIANGYTAGQFSPHFMVHIIPRDPGDGLSMFETEGKAKIDDRLYQALRTNLAASVESHLKRYPESWHEAREIRKEYTREQVIEIVENNKGLKDAIMTAPLDFIRQVKTHPQLKDLFLHVKPEEIVEHFNPKFKIAETVDDPVAVPASEVAQQARHDDASAVTSEDPPEKEEGPMTKEDVIAMLRENPKALEMIEKAPDEFKKRAKENPNLSRMFSKVDLDEVIAALNDKGLERKL